MLFTPAESGRYFWIQTNVIFKNLKNLKEEDIHLEYTDEILEEILNDIKDHIDDVNRYENFKKI